MKSIQDDVKTPTNAKSIPATAYVVLVAAQLAVGAAAIFARFALHGTGPIAAAALRLDLAALPLLMFIFTRYRKLAVPRHHEFLMAGAGVALAVHFATWIGSLLYTSVAVSTLLVSSSPVWTAIYDIAFLKKPATKSFWFAMFTGAAGTILIATSESASVPVAGLSIFGDSLALAGGAALAVYLILITSISNRYPTIVIVGRTYTWAAIALSLTACLAKQPLPGNDWTSWGGIVAMALISQLLGHTGINSSLRWFSSTTVAFSTLLEPVFAAILATFLFSETISAQIVLGGSAILAALALILRKGDMQVENAAT